MFKFNTNKVYWNHPIGKGNFASVYPYGKEQSNSKWVVKWVNALSVDKVLKTMEQIIVGFNLEHPAILPIKGYKIEPTKPKGWNIYTKLPRMATDLRKVINNCIENNKIVPEKEIIQYLHTLVCGLEYLHDRRIPHMSIKPENILISSQGKVKLSDVSGVRVIETEHSFHTSTEAVGTQAYVAPELLQDHQGLKRKQLFMADMWSLGAVIGEVMLLKRVSNDQEEGEIVKDLMQIEGRYSKAVIELVIDMLHMDPSKRKSASEIKKVLEERYSDLVESSERIVQNEVEEFKNNNEGDFGEKEQCFQTETSEDFSPRSPGFRVLKSESEGLDSKSDSPISAGLLNNQIAISKY